MAPCISIRQLHRRYGARRGVEGLSLEVAEGSIFGFLGPNGAGKTTAIRVLLGFLRPHSGAATVFGLDCWTDSARIKRDVGYLPGDVRIYANWTGRSAIDLLGRIRGVDLRRLAAGLAERFGLEMDVPVRNMSRGMRQKLGLILALAHDPRLLLLDEPSAGLDPLMQRELRDVLRERAAAGRTVFFSSHTLAEVEQLCEEVAIIRDGRIVACAGLEELRRNAGHVVTIRWKDGRGTTIEPPAFLGLDRRDAGQWTGRVEGPIAVLIRWLADQPVEDLAVGRPDLDVLFRRYYQTP